MAKNLILWLVIAVVLMSVFQSFAPSSSKDQQLDYTRFIQDVRQGQVREASIDRNGVVQGTKRSGESFVTVIPGGYDRDLINDLVKQGVRASGKLPEEQSFLTSILISWFPMLLLIGVWIFFMRQMQGGGGKGAMSFGKSKARQLGEDQIKTTFADVAGCDEAKEEVAELVDYLKEVFLHFADYLLKINNQEKLIIEAKKTSVKLSEEEGRQAVSYAHHKNIKFSVLTNFKEIRVYHALSRIKNIDKNLLKDKNGKKFWIKCEDFVEQFDRLWLLSRESFEKEEINKLLHNVDKKLIKPIDETILKDLLDFRGLLSKELKDKRIYLSPEQIDEAVQILIDRLIFMRSVEDRGLETRDFLLKIANDTQKGFEELNLWTILKTQFERFDDVYNSKLFSKGLLEKDDVFFSGIILTKIIKGLYFGIRGDQIRYEYNEIPVDLLGNIYEQYLGIVLRGTEKRVKLDLESGKRKKMGIYYTPKYIVDYILDNTLVEYAKSKTLDEILNMKVVDPACGSGSFLLDAFEELKKIIEDRLKKGEKSKIIIPSQLAFGRVGSSTKIVPPYTTVIYNLEIIND